MATNRDIAILRQLFQQGRLGRDQALLCLQHVDRQAEQGHSLDALGAARELGLLEQQEESGLHRREVYVDLDQAAQGLAGFELGPVIEQGRLGMSYQGRRQRDGAPVLVRSLHPGFSEYPTLLELITCDLEAWVGFQHPRLAGTLAVGNAHGRVVAVFACPEGRSLRDVLSEAGGKLPPAGAAQIVRDLAQGLAAAHERGLYAGDLRPETVCHDGKHSQLVDLGLARAACIAQGFGRHGLPFGHPHYLAPEALQGAGDTPQAAGDIYALGVLFYELLAGAPPFEGDVLAILEQHFQTPLPPLPSGTGLSKPWGELLLRMTAKAPDKRPSALEVLRGIQGPTTEGSQRVEWGLVSAETGHGRLEEEWTRERILQAPSQESGTGDIFEETSDVEPGDEDVEEVKVRRQLGRGAVGTSYLGTAPGIEGRVVVKILSRKFALKKELYARILTDVSASTRLRHANVLANLRLTRLGERDVVVQEHAEGSTLRTILKEKSRLSIPEALSLISDLTLALAAAEAKGLSHGDIRPEKVYLDPDAPARLADFGLAEAACRGAGFTQHGIRFGHPLYLAPEALQEQSAGPSLQADIYALGILLYEVLTGAPPFRGETPQQTLVQHLRSPLPPPPDSLELRPALVELLLKMTAKAPQARYARPAELLKALESCEGELQAQSADDPLGSMGLELNYDPLGSDVWDQEALLMSAPDIGWDKFKIATSETSQAVSRWQPDEANDGQLYDVLSSQEVAHPGAILASLTPPPQAAPAARASSRRVAVAAQEAPAETPETTPRRRAVWPLLLFAPLSFGALAWPAHAFLGRPLLESVGVALLASAIGTGLLAFAWLRKSD